MIEFFNELLFPLQNLTFSNPFGEVFIFAVSACVIVSGLVVFREIIDMFI